MYTGSGQQLDKLMKDQLFGIKTVSTIDYVGYSKEYGCYVYGDIAIKEGVTYKVNSEDYFEFGKLRLKTLQKAYPSRCSAMAKTSTKPGCNCSGHALAPKAWWHWCSFRLTVLRADPWPLPVVSLP